MTRGRPSATCVGCFHVHVTCVRDNPEGPCRRCLARQTPCEVRERRVEIRRKKELEETLTSAEFEKLPWTQMVPRLGPQFIAGQEAPIMTYSGSSTISETSARSTQRGRAALSGGRGSSGGSRTKAGKVTASPTREWVATVPSTHDDGTVTMDLAPDGFPALSVSRAIAASPYAFEAPSVTSCSLDGVSSSGEESEESRTPRSASDGFMVPSSFSFTFDSPSSDPESGVSGPVSEISGPDASQSGMMMGADIIPGAGVSRTLFLDSGMFDCGSASYGSGSELGLLSVSDDASHLLQSSAANVEQFDETGKYALTVTTVTRRWPASTEPLVAQVPWQRPSVAGVLVEREVLSAMPNFPIFDVFDSEDAIRTKRYHGARQVQIRDSPELHAMNERKSPDTDVLVLYVTVRCNLRAALTFSLNVEDDMLLRFFAGVLAHEPPAIELAREIGYLRMVYRTMCGDPDFPFMCEIATFVDAKDGPGLREWMVDHHAPERIFTLEQMMFMVYRLYRSALLDDIYGKSKIVRKSLYAMMSRTLEFGNRPETRVVHQYVDGELLPAAPDHPDALEIHGTLRNGHKLVPVSTLVRTIARIRTSEFKKFASCAE